MKDTLTKKYGVDVRTNVENRRITESWDAMQRQVGPGPLTVAVSKQPHLCTVVALYSVAGSTHTPTLRPFTVLLSAVTVLVLSVAVSSFCWRSYTVTFYTVAVSGHSPRAECGCEQSRSCWLSVWTVALFTV